MPGWRYVRGLFSELLVSLRKEFEGKVWSGVRMALVGIAQPQTKEYLSCQAKGDIVVAEGLVLCDASQTKAKLSNFLYIHFLLGTGKQGAVCLNAPFLIFS